MQDQPERTSDVVNNQIYYQLKWIPWGPGDDEFVPIVTQVSVRNLSKVMRWRTLGGA